MPLFSRFQTNSKPYEHRDPSHYVHIVFTIYRIKISFIAHLQNCICFLVSRLVFADTFRGRKDSDKEDSFFLFLGICYVGLFTQPILLLWFCVCVSSQSTWFGFYATFKLISTTNFLPEMKIKTKFFFVIYLHLYRRTLQFHCFKVYCFKLFAFAITL